LAAIELRVDGSPQRALDLGEHLAIAVGKPIDPQRIRRTLSNLYATGLVAEAEMWTRDEPSGPVAVVVVRTHTWVRSVRLEGEELGLRRIELERTLEQRAGTPLIDTRVLRSVYALQDLYEERGFRRHRVRVAVDPIGEGSGVDVIFAVASGPRMTVGEVRFEGDLGPFDRTQLLQPLRLQEGKGFDPRHLKVDARELRAWLVEEGRLSAQVSTPEEIYDATSDRMSIIHHLEVGPRVVIEVSGAERQKLAKQGLLPFLDDQVYDDALVIQTCTRLRSHFQRQGYHRATIECPEERVGDELHRRIEVELGETWHLSEVHFSGHHFADADTLRSLMNTAPPSGLLRRGGRLVDEVLEEDLANIRSFYLLNGFPEPQVGPAEVMHSEGQIELHIPISEGPRQRVVELSIDGDTASAAGLAASTAFGDRQLRDSLPLKPGGPYHRALLDESLNLLRALYEEEGYREITVDAQLDWNPDSTLVDVAFEIAPGRQETIDRVILRGLELTRPEVVRKFSPLESGQPISRRRLLEAERDLYRLGIFSRVEVERGPDHAGDGRRDVLVRLEEGRRWRLSYGLSYHSGDGIGGLLGLSRTNIGGKAGRLQLDFRGNRVDSRFRLLFDQPSVGRWRLPITYSLCRQQEERDAFTVNDLGVRVAITKDTQGARFGLAYEYRLVDSRFDELSLGEIDRADREIQISSLTPNLFIDRRDDPLDASRGWSTALQLEYAFQLLDADAEFLKLFWQQTQYLHLQRFGILATSLRLGLIHPNGRGATPDPLVPEDLASARVPISERFFLGGRTTHRAYDRDSLGILGQTLVGSAGQQVEVGGNGLFLLNLDYRFPISGDLGGTVFFDTGNVWADWRDFDSSDLKPGTGLGLRYRSPIGPLRFDIGWKLDREAFEDATPTFFITFGNPFLRGFFGLGTGSSCSVMVINWPSQSRSSSCSSMRNAGLAPG